MKTIKKITKGHLIEKISDKLSIVANSNGWIICNMDGSFYRHPVEGYLQFKNKGIANEVAAAY